MWSGVSLYAVTLPQVATVSERSRIMELERDLALRDKEVAALRQHMESASGEGGSGVDPAAGVLQEEVATLRAQLSSQGAGHKAELQDMRERLEAAERAHGEALAQLQASSGRLSKDNEQLRARLAQAEQENADVIELWRSKLASAMASHQQAMEELRATSEKGAGGAQAAELVELRGALERLKVEHKLALEEAGAQREAEATARSQEAEELKGRLLSLTEEKERLEESLRTNVESAEEQHLVEMEEVLGKLHTAELRVKELEEERSQLGQQADGKAKEAQELAASLESLRSQQTQGNQDMQGLRAQLEEAEGKARSQEGKVGAPCPSVHSLQSCLLHFILPFTISFPHHGPEQHEFQIQMFVNDPKHAFYPFIFLDQRPKAKTALSLPLYVFILICHLFVCVSLSPPSLPSPSPPSCSSCSSSSPTIGLDPSWVS